VLPEGFPPIVLPAVYLLITHLLTKEHFLSKEAIESSDQYELRSVGQSVLVSLMLRLSLFSATDFFYNEGGTFSRTEGNYLIGGGTMMLWGVE
jgi:hypothetical protein